MNSQFVTFWVSVTKAELTLHEYLLDHPDGPISRRAGDPPVAIAAIQAVFPYGRP